METIVSMRKRHAKEIKTLQKNCLHKKISSWLSYMWAPGHFDGEVKVCLACGKTIEKRNQFDPKTLLNEKPQVTISKG